MLSTLRSDNSPFNEQQLKQLHSSIDGLNPLQSQWLSGYLAGRLADSVQASDGPQSKPETTASLAVIYATETGNSEAIANGLVAGVEQQGVCVQLHSMDNFRPPALRKLTNVAFVISTHGEGEPPEEALELFEYLENDRAPKLPELNYRVLALGDRSYPLFCEAGRRLDERLQSLGAHRFGQRIECDVDFTGNAKVYTDEVTRFAREHLCTEIQDTKTVATNTNRLRLILDGPHWSRQKPVAAELLRVQKITGFESEKDVYHLELSLQNPALKYQPGDALGVWAPNDPQLVERILEQLQIDPAARVRVKHQDLSSYDALTRHLEITRLTADTILGCAITGGQRELESFFSGLDAAQQRTFIEQRQLADLVDEYPMVCDPQALVDVLRPLSPRSYSIACSQNMVDEEVHLTVATRHSAAIGVPRQGLVSGYLNQRLAPPGQVQVFLESNRRFRLPDNPATPLIMIGAGTGIAPYRAFMQALESQASNPDSWLIFGNPHLRTDFLYQREWLHWRDAGLLNRIDTAWSRDQPEKRYVQDVVQEQAARFDRWLQRGATVYLCGSMQMGQAVQDMLHQVLIEQRGITPDAATVVLAELRRSGHLKKDLY